MDQEGPRGPIDESTPVLMSDSARIEAALELIATIRERGHQPWYENTASHDMPWKIHCVKVDDLNVIEAALRAADGVQTEPARADDLQNAQLREWLIDTERMRDEAVRLLAEWDERETAIAIAMCGTEPVVQEGSFVYRLRQLLQRAGLGSEETRDD